MRNQKGVSLITLVITIIVVIILAAIALGGGAADTAGQAQFSGFATEMGGLQESVQTAITTAKGDEAIRGNSRTNEQLANYVARGGRYNDKLTPDASGDKGWLVQADARSIPCTLIEKEHAEKVFGSNLPVRKVETDMGTNQEVSYFVTPKGNVFCWPPYVYDDKSYVTNTVTVHKSGDTAELKDTEATVDGNYVVTFNAGTNAEENVYIVVDSTPAATPESCTRGNVPSVGVWYTSSDNDESTIRGVAEGIEFDDYDNTQVGA